MVFMEKLQTFLEALFTCSAKEFVEFANVTLLMCLIDVTGRTDGQRVVLPFKVAS